jgi:hypothetical protein
MNPHFNLEIACAVESVIPKLPPTSGMEFRWKVRSNVAKNQATHPKYKQEGVEGCEVPETQRRHLNPASRQR